jgi:galactose mutarotase-like enzyme
LKNFSTKKECIWQGDPTYWGKHAPILFPIVGTLKNNKYQYNKEEYCLPRHGFARVSEFTLLEKDESSVTFFLKHSEETLAVYPFEFELQIRYKIIGSQLSTSYTVHNVGNLQMAFSIGAHPAFALSEPFENYALQFEKTEPLLSNLLENNLLSDRTKIIGNESGIVPLSYALFENDALVFKSLSSRSVTILENNSPILKVKFDDFPNLGIWTLNDAPFICIEPWFGFSDTAACSGNIIEKEGIQLLESRKIFKAEHAIEVL